MSGSLSQNQFESEQTEDSDVVLDLGFVLKLCLWATVTALGVIASCFGGMLMVVAVGTANSAEAADAWLTLLSERRIDDAYAISSALFRATTEEDEFAEFGEHFAQVDYGMRPWRDRYLEVNGQTRYHVNLIDANGTELPLVVFMAFEDGQWRVFSTVAPQWSLPSEERIQDIVRDTMNDVAEAITNRDFKELHRKASVALSQQASPSILQVVFQDFIDDKIDILVSAFGEAIFKERPHIVRVALGSAVMDVLVAEGYYSLGPSPWDPDPRPGVETRVFFNFKYTYENDAWRLWQIDVDLPRVVVSSEEKVRDALTETEVVVLGLMAEGLNVEGIGRRLVMTKRVVENHIESILMKFDVTTWDQAVRIGMEQGQIEHLGNEDLFWKNLSP